MPRGAPSWACNDQQRRGLDQLYGPPSVADDPRLNAVGSVVDFGGVQTDGMISMTQQAGQWVVRPFPRSRNFTVLLNSSTYPPPPSAHAGGGTTTAVTLVQRSRYWELPLNGAKTYSWPMP